MASARVDGRRRTASLERSPELSHSAPGAVSVGAPAVLVAAARSDLSTAARVCSDMARVLDAGDLPGLLARAAGVLDAPGVIVWVADRAATRCSRC